MYRVVVPALIALLLPACSLGSKPISLGLTDTPPSTGSTARASKPSPALANGEASRLSAKPAAETKVAALAPDKAPQGAFEKAPPGALADRDYATTRLDAERARDLINAYRKEKGLKPLKLNTELTNAAKLHSKDLAKWDRISHYGSDGSNPWDRVKHSGYRARLAAENVGTGQASIDEVFKGWQQSPGHNKNLLLADAEHIGIALVQDPKTEFKTFWTLVIASPM